MKFQLMLIICIVNTAIDVYRETLGHNARGGVCVVKRVKVNKYATKRRAFHIEGPP